MLSKRWYAVLFMALLYALSSVDRYITVLLLADIGAEFGASDTTLALLVGAAFSIVYAIGGVPVAYLLDRYHRIGIVAVGVLLWSVCTALSGLAPDFTWLMILRGGVALGEAVVTPATVSLVADLFDGRSRVRALAVYGLVASLMVTGALVIGGMALGLANHIAAAGATLVPWRLTFLVVGLPGIVLAGLAILTIGEPARQSGTVAKGNSTSLFAQRGFVRSNAAFFGFYYLGLGALNSIIVSALTWTPTIARRTFEVPAAEAGIKLGIAGVPGILLGTFLWLKFGEAAERTGSAHSYLKGFALATAVLGGGAFAAALAPSLDILLICAFIAAIGTAASTTLAPMLVQTIGPPTIKAQLTAMNILFGTLVGMTLGPLGVTVFAQLAGTSD
jgi:Arabinose efflux permease